MNTTPSARINQNLTLQPWSNLGTIPCVLLIFSISKAQLLHACRYTKPGAYTLSFFLTCTYRSLSYIECGGTEEGLHNSHTIENFSRTTCTRRVEQLWPKHQ